MKKIFFSLISLFLGITLFFWLLNEIGWQEIKDTFLGFSGIEGGFLLFLGFLCTFLGTLRWREILKSTGHHFSLKELYGHYLASWSITYLAPVVIFGGEIFRGYVLNSKRENSTSLEKGMAASFIDGILEYAFEWLALFLGLASFFLTVGFPLKGSQILIFVILFFLTGSFFYYFFVKKKSFLKIFFKVSERNQGRRIEKETLSFFKIKNRAFQKALLLSFSKTVVRFFQYWILVEFLGKSISSFAAISILGISILSMAPPISADLGTHDLGSALLFEKLGLGQETGLVFASIVRGINLVLALFGIVFLIKTGFDTLQQKLLKQINRVALK